MKTIVKKRLPVLVYPFDDDHATLTECCFSLHCEVEGDRVELRRAVAETAFRTLSVDTESAACTFPDVYAEARRQVADDIVRDI